MSRCTCSRKESTEAVSGRAIPRWMPGRCCLRRGCAPVVSSRRRNDCSIMKTTTFVTIAVCLLAPVAALCQEDPLQRDFLNPPASARPRVWWHWMNGNITKEGIRQDLEWMKRVGIESNTTQAPGPIRRRWTFRLHGSRAGKTRCWISATSASSQTLCRPTKPTRRSVHQDCLVRSGCCNRTASEPLFQLQHNDRFGRQVQSQIRARDLVGRERCGLNRARIVERIHHVHRLRGEDLPGDGPDLR